MLGIVRNWDTEIVDMGNRYTYLSPFKWVITDGYGPIYGS